MITKYETLCLIKYISFQCIFTLLFIQVTFPENMMTDILQSDVSGKKLCDHYYYSIYRVTWHNLVIPNVEESEKLRCAEKLKSHTKQ